MTKDDMEVDPNCITGIFSEERDLPEFSEALANLDAGKPDVVKKYGDAWIAHFKKKHGDAAISEIDFVKMRQNAIEDKWALARKQYERNKRIEEEGDVNKASEDTINHLKHLEIHKQMFEAIKDTLHKNAEDSKYTILDEAKDIIYGDRERTYGAPTKNLKKIAELWSVYLEKEITSSDVCNMMILLKLARLANNPTHLDSIVDIAGYAALHERLKEE